MTGRVLIAGAGPVGMSLALALARRGVPSVLLDRGAGPGRAGSRSIVLSRGTLETYRALGCGDAMIAEGLVLRRARTYFRGKELFRVDFEPPADGDVPRFVNLQQTATERILREHVDRESLIELEWDAEIDALDQHDASVTVRAGPRRWEGRWLAGCDGAGSAVRRLLGVPFPGRTYPDRFLIADVRAALGLGNERHFHFSPPSNPGRQCLIHPQPLGEWRLDWQVPPDVDAESERRSGRLDERIRALIGDDTGYELTWLTAYRFHQRCAARFRARNAFLCGDAAHLVAPFGARGLNSGVEDARVLAEVLGTGGGADAYEARRRPVALEHLRVTGATMRFMAPPTPLHRLRRELILRGSVRVPRLRRHVDSGRLPDAA
jgi:2-polyprenyl-6-methoxyphenol hydroxylase-like FAD-dependent oxidoreductase